MKKEERKLKNKKLKPYLVTFSFEEKAYDNKVVVLAVDKKEAIQKIIDYTFLPKGEMDITKAEKVDRETLYIKKLRVKHIKHIARENDDSYLV